MDVVSISVDSHYERNAVMYRHHFQDSDTYKYPVVLLSHDSQLSDHLMNIMAIELYESKEMPSKKADILPNVFVILAISEPLIFGYEFMEGLLKQEYPKENIILCICTKTNHSGRFIVLYFQRTNIDDYCFNLPISYKDILEMFQKSNFAKIICTNSNHLLRQIQPNLGSCHSKILQKKFSENLNYLYMQ